MKRGKKLLLLVLVLAILSGAAAVLTHLDLNGSGPEEEEPSVSILTLDTAQVTALSFTNLEEETLSFTREEDGWAYDGDESFPLDTQIVDTMLSALSNVQASRAIDEPEEAAQYGLNRPMCIIEVTAADTVYRLELGDENSLGGYRYAGNGDGRVYLVDAGLLDCFDYQLIDLVQEEALPDMDAITGLSIDAETQQMKLVYLEDSGLAYSDEYVWFLETEEGYTCLDNELVDDLLYEFRTLGWAECVDYRAEGEALAAYGLDQPAATVTVDYADSYKVATGETDENGETVYETRTETGTLVLEIGSYTGDGCCYARLAGSRMVYLIDAAVSDAALYTRADALLPDEVLLMDFDALTGVDIVLDGQTYSITAETVTETDADGNTTEKRVYHLGDRQVWLDDTLKKLSGIASVGYAADLTPERGEEIRFRFYRDDENYPVVELCFYQYDSTRCLTELMGKTTVFAAREDVSELVDTIRTAVGE